MMDGHGETKTKIETETFSVDDNGNGRRSFLLSSIPSLTQRENLKRMIVELGGIYVDSQNFDNSASHVICGRLSRTEKFIGACVSGKWILPTKYIEHSYEVKMWLEEEDYEFSLLDKVQPKGLASAARRWKWKYKTYKTLPFTDWHISLKMEAKKRASFKRILQCGGAKLIPYRGRQTASKVAFVLVDSKEYDTVSKLQEELDILFIREDYLGDYVIKDPEPDLFDYRIDQNTAVNSVHHLDADLIESPLQTPKANQPNSTSTESGYESGSSKTGETIDLLKKEINISVDDVKCLKGTDFGNRLDNICTEAVKESVESKAIKIVAVKDQSKSRKVKRPFSVKISDICHDAMPIISLERCDVNGPPSKKIKTDVSDIFLCEPDGLKIKSQPLKIYEDSPVEKPVPSFSCSNVVYECDSEIQFNFKSAHSKPTALADHSNVPIDHRHTSSIQKGSDKKPSISQISTSLELPGENIYSLESSNKELGKKASVTSSETSCDSLNSSVEVKPLISSIKTQSVVSAVSSTPERKPLVSDVSTASSSPGLKNPVQMSLQRFGFSQNKAPSPKEKNQRDGPPLPFPIFTSMKKSSSAVKRCFQSLANGSNKSISDLDLQSASTSADSTHTSSLMDENSQSDSIVVISSDDENESLEEVMEDIIQLCDDVDNSYTNVSTHKQSDIDSSVLGNSITTISAHNVSKTTTSASVFSKFVRSTPRSDSKTAATSLCDSKTTASASSSSSLKISDLSTSETFPSSSSSSKTTVPAPCSNSKSNFISSCNSKSVSPSLDSPIAQYYEPINLLRKEQNRQSSCEISSNGLISCSDIGSNTNSLPVSENGNIQKLNHIDEDDKIINGSDLLKKSNKSSSLNSISSSLFSLYLTSEASAPLKGLCLNGDSKTTASSLIPQWMEATRDMEFFTTSLEHGRPDVSHSPTGEILLQLMRLTTNKKPHIRNLAYNYLMTWLEGYPPISSSSINFYRNFFGLDYEKRVLTDILDSLIISPECDGNQLLFNYIVTVLDINLWHLVNSGNKREVQESLLVKWLWSDCGSPSQVYFSISVARVLEAFGAVLSVKNDGVNSQCIINSMVTLLGLVAECLRLVANCWNVKSFTSLSNDMISFCVSASRKIKDAFSKGHEYRILLILRSLNPAWFRTYVTASIMTNLNDFLVMESIQIGNISLRAVVQQYFFLLPSLSEIPARTSQRTIKPSSKVLDNINAAKSSRPVNPSSKVLDSIEVNKPSRPMKINKRNGRGETAVHLAAAKNDVDRMRQLLRVPGVDVNMKDNSGWTPLHEACNHGSYECVELLLNHVPCVNTVFGESGETGKRVDISAKGFVSKTPLHDAVSNGHVNICKLLLKYGGRKLLDAKTDDGYTPLDLATTAEMRSVLGFDDSSSSLNSTQISTRCTAQQGDTNNLQLTDSVMPTLSLYNEVLTLQGRKMHVNLKDSMWFFSLLNLLLSSYLEHAMLKHLNSGNTCDEDVMKNFDCHLGVLKDHMKKISLPEHLKVIQSQIDLLKVIVCEYVGKK